MKPETTNIEPILFYWSGGKDSAMALHALLQRKDVRVTSLLTTVTEGYERKRRQRGAACGAAG